MEGRQLVGSQEVCDEHQDADAVALRQRFFAKGPTAAARKSLALWQVGVEQMLSESVSVVSVVLSQA